MTRCVHQWAEYGDSIMNTSEKSVIKGKYIAITGILMFYKREEAFERIRDLGGIPQENVTKETDYLVVGHYRKNTIIAGSSMGGLIALYGVTTFNHVFQRAACLSPSLWTDPKRLLQIVEKAEIKNDTCIYMDYGSEEMFNHAANAEALISTSHLLLTKRVNLAFRIVPGGNHSEASWERQIPIFMDCLGL